MRNRFHCSELDGTLCATRFELKEAMDALHDCTVASLKALSLTVRQILTLDMAAETASVDGMTTFSLTAADATTRTVRRRHWRRLVATFRLPECRSTPCPASYRQDRLSQRQRSRWIVALPMRSANHHYRLVSGPIPELTHRRTKVTLAYLVEAEWHRTDDGALFELITAHPRPYGSYSNDTEHKNASRLPHECDTEACRMRDFDPCWERELTRCTSGTHVTVRCMWTPGANGRHLTCASLSTPLSHDERLVISLVNLFCVPRIGVWRGFIICWLPHTTSDTSLSSTSTQFTVFAEWMMPRLPQGSAAWIGGTGTPAPSPSSPHACAPDPLTS